MNKKHCLSIAALLIVASINAQTVNNTQANGVNPLSGQHAVGGNWGIKPAIITDSTLPRILLMGDSMLGQYGEEVVKELLGLANVDRWTTGAFVSDKMIAAMTQVVSSQHYKIIHFNESGLHSLSEDRVPHGEYGLRMEKYLKAMKQAAPDAQLIWATTTPVTVKGMPGILDDTLTNVVVEHNTATEPFIKNYNIHVDDLYTLMMGNLNLAKGDKWHWKSQGAMLMAKAVVASIKKELEGK